MMARSKTVIKNYWEKNVKEFAGFYDKNSEEHIKGNQGFRYLYKKFIFPIEKIFMLKRYNIVSDYIEKNVRLGMKVADIGCGNGIFTKKMAGKKAKVYALDYTQSALNLTKNNLTLEESKSVELIKLDITSEHIPFVDLAISIGVLPYVYELDIFFDNILPFTSSFLFNYLDSNHPINIVRRIMPILDVRNYCYHNRKNIKNKLEVRNFKINFEQNLATGFIVSSKKNIF